MGDDCDPAWIFSATRASKKPKKTKENNYIFLGGDFIAGGTKRAVGTQEGFFLRFATKASHRAERPANSLAG